MHSIVASAGNSAAEGMSYSEHGGKGDSFTWSAPYLSSQEVMSPDSTMDNMLPSTSSALFNIPKLAEDGSNWITYKERILTVLGVRGLMWYINGRAVKPIPFVIDESMGAPKKANGSTPSQTKIEELDKKLDEFFQKDLVVKQQIFSTITDRLLLHIQKLDHASSI
jgi:hypothetical protein